MNFLNNALIFIASVFSICFLLMIISPFKQKFKKIDKNGKYEPFISVIIPCKGSSEEFKAFLHSLEKQKYKKVEYLFCLSNKNDGAVKTIGKNLKNVKYRIIISKYLDDTSDMNQNQIAGIKEMNSRTDVIAVIDSDGILDNDYIYSLVEPLQDEKYIISSTYRNYRAESLGGLIVKYWNLISLSIKQLPGITFAWGGGMAFRKKDLSKLKLPEKWKGIVSDDMPLNRLTYENGTTVYAVRKYCISESDKNIFSAFKWITYQQLMLQRYFRLIYFIDGICILFFVVYLFLFLYTKNILMLLPFIFLFISLLVLTLKYEKKERVKEIIALPFIFIGIIFVNIYSFIAPPFYKRLIWSGIVYDIDNKGRITNKQYQ